MGYVVHNSHSIMQAIQINGLTFDFPTMLDIEDQSCYD
jgi:hypothetical protein